MGIWLLLVDHKFQAMGRRFEVDTISGDDNINTLKEKAKEKRQIRLAGVDAADLTVWKTKGSMIINRVTSSSLVDILKNIDVGDENAIVLPDEEERVADLGLSVGETLLVQVPAQLPDPKRVHQVITSTSDDDSEARNAIPELKEFQRYNKTVVTPGLSPSEGAKSTGYRKIQANDALVIHDGRTAPDSPLPTIAPPIQIFHPIFNDFIRSVNDDVQPTAEDLKNVYEFMCSLAEVGRLENKSSQALLPFLRRILVADVHEEQMPDGSRPDGVVMVQTDKARIASFFLELKREIGEGGCDPTTQVSLSMRRTWIHNSSDYIRQRCCCPTFLIGAGGPWWSVLGSVFTDKFIVQRLTTMEWMVLSSTDEYNRIYRNAKIFVALRNCLSKLQIFYNTLGDVSPLVANQPHPRYFPYPSSFTAEDGSVTRFQYLKSLEEDAACVTYLAETRPDEHGSVPEKVVVKFVSRYGKEVHEFLAGETYAPSLRYYGPLSGTGFSGVFPGPAQSAPPNPHSPSPMYMVVMDYIEARPNTPRDISAQIRTILTRLHSEGYVFGDLRKQNILFDADGKVKLIDFNWCGRYDMKIADENLPEDVQDHIDQNKRRVQAGGPYAYAQYPVSMSTLKGMWAPGMVPLGSIRPIHDWMMFKRLPWQG